MRQQVRTAVLSDPEHVPAILYAGRDFSVWRRVKGAQFVSVIALLFWGAVFFALFG